MKCPFTSRATRLLLWAAAVALATLAMVVAAEVIYLAVAHLAGSTSPTT